VGCRARRRSRASDDEQQQRSESARDSPRLRHRAERSTRPWTRNPPPAMRGPMFHSLLRLWFELVRDWGYWGVALMMAIESTVFPLPSEVVVPPAAYWATQGQMSFWGVVAAATLGSWLGSGL